MYIKVFLKFVSISKSGNNLKYKHENSLTIYEMENFTLKQKIQNDMYTKGGTILKIHLTKDES